MISRGTLAVARGVSRFALRRPASVSGYNPRSLVSTNPGCVFLPIRIRNAEGGEEMGRGIAARVNPAGMHSDHRTQRR